MWTQARQQKSFKQSFLGNPSSCGRSGGLEMIEFNAKQGSSINVIHNEAQKKRKWKWKEAQRKQGGHEITQKLESARS